MYKYSIFFVLLFFIACTPKTVHVWKDDINAQKNFTLYVVEEIISGDTIKLTDGKTVRYIGIRSPEKGELYFEEARKVHKYYLGNGNIFLKFDKSIDPGKNDMYYAYAFKPVGAGVFSFLNLELLQTGSAQIYDQSKILPKYRENFYKAQNRAKRKKVGLWKYK